MRAIVRGIRQLFSLDTSDNRLERAEKKSQQLTTTVEELRQSQKQLADTLEETGFFLGDAMRRKRPPHDDLPRSC